jgi:hypothetical protein
VSLNKIPKLILVDAMCICSQKTKVNFKMQINMTSPVGKVTCHVVEWILNIYSPTAKFGCIGEWLSTTLLVVLNIFVCKEVHFNFAINTIIMHSAVNK